MGEDAFAIEIRQFADFAYHIERLALQDAKAPHAGVDLEVDAGRDARLRRGA